MLIRRLCSSPYVVLAHYLELDWVWQYFLLITLLLLGNKLMGLIFQARSFNVDPDLVRISVGLEEVSDLRGRFQRALDAVEKVKK